MQARPVEESDYWDYVLLTVEQQDLEKLLNIWKTSRQQGSFGRKVREAITQAAPTIARVKGLKLKENTFRALVEAHDRKRIKELCAGDKNCLLTFVEEDNLYVLKQLLPERNGFDIWEALEAVIKTDNLRLFKFLFAALKEKLAEDTELGAEEKEFLLSLEDLLHDSALHNSVEIIDFLITLDVSLDSGLAGAAQGGHEKLVDFFLEKGADPRFLLEGAIMGNHLHLLDYAEKFLPFTQEVLDYTLRFAVNNKQWEAANYLYRKGAKNTKYELFLAIQEDDLELVEEVGKTLNEVELSEVFEWLEKLYGGDTAKIADVEEIFDFLIEKIDKRR